MKRQTLEQGGLILIVKAEKDDDSQLRKLLLGYLAECNCTGVINATRMGKQRGTKSPNPVRVSRGLNFATMKVEDRAENCFEYRVYPPNRMSLDTFMQMVLRNDSRKNSGGQVPAVEKATEKNTGHPAPQAKTEVTVTVAETGTPAQIVGDEGASPAKTDGATPSTSIETKTKEPFKLKDFFDDPEQMDVLVLSLKELFEKRPFVPTSELTKFLVDVLKCETNRIAPLYARLVNLQNGFHLEHANKGEVQGYKAVYSDRERNPRKHPDVIGGNANTLNVITSKLREIEGLLRASADEIHSLIGSIETFGPSFERLTQLEEVMKTLQGALPK